MSLVDDIKRQAKKTGANKGKFMYFKPGVKIRIRFLTDMDDGIKVPFHDSFTRSINVPCQEQFDRTCKFCEDEDLRHRDQYAWPVWDYESKEVKILMFPVNQCTPVSTLVDFYQSYGTLMDRDYVLTRNGTQQSTTYSVVPMDKAKFRNTKAKPLSTSAFYKLLDKAFPPDSSGAKDNDDYDDDDYDDETDDEEMDYEDMGLKELYKLCKKRDIDVKPKKKKSYYIEKLEAADNAEYDDDDYDEEDEDEWDD